MDATVANAIQLDRLASSATETMELVFVCLDPEDLFVMSVPEDTPVLGLTVSHVENASTNGTESLWDLKNRLVT